MHGTVESDMRVDAEGNPAGGTTVGRGFEIEWQNGPLSVDGVRVDPTGAFVEDVIEAAIQRLEFYQEGKFACCENEEALIRLKGASTVLDERTKAREARGVEGTLEP